MQDKYLSVAKAYCQRIGWKVEDSVAVMGTHYSIENAFWAWDGTDLVLVRVVDGSPDQYIVPAKKAQVTRAAKHINAARVDYIFIKSLADDGIPRALLAHRRGKELKYV
jgi:hypothetical protein